MGVVMVSRELQEPGRRNGYPRRRRAHLSSLNRNAVPAARLW